MFYQISFDEGEKRKYAEAIGISDWPEIPISCTQCKRQWNKSIIYEYGTKVPITLSNKNYPDFIWYYIWHISEQAKKVIEDEKISGYILENADVLSIRDLSAEQKRELKSDGIKINNIPEQLPQYYKLHIDVGAEYHEKSNIILVESCYACGYEKYVTIGKNWVEVEPVIIKRDSCNGNDLFLCKGYGISTFCNEKFFEVYNKHHLTGLNFKVIEVV